MKIIGIAGGSGAGKSAVSYFLQDSNTSELEVLNFDDYQVQKVDENSPTLAGMTNWDHPDIIRWDDLIRDVKTLKSGSAITLQTWSHRSNPDYRHTRKMIERIVKPTNWLIVEGCLALYDANLRRLFDYSFYLELDANSRASRRDKNGIVGNDNYNEKVLEPMFKEYVEPTREKAKEILDVSGMSVESVAEQIQQSVGL